MKFKSVTLALLTASILMAPNTEALGQSKKKTQQSAIDAPTLYIKSGQNKIAYRSIGKGSPIILCNRLRGVLDTWDPAFIDGLAKGNRVIIFDYPGIGLSTGRLAPTIGGVASDVREFAKAMKLEKFRLLGWSYGGAVAQTLAAQYPQAVSHLILIGANPPGKNDTPVEKAFLDAAFKPVNDLSDEEVLFFEPASAKSRAAAKASRERISSRKNDLSIMVTPDKFGDYFKGIADFQQDASNNRDKLAKTLIPILIIMGDHDPSCPVENWYPLVKKWKTAHLLIIPNSGHGVQHEYPKFSVAQINLFAGTH